MQFYKIEVALSPFPRSLKNIKVLETFHGHPVGFEYTEVL